MTYASAILQICHILFIFNPRKEIFGVREAYTVINNHKLLIWVFNTGCSRK